MKSRKPTSTYSFTATLDRMDGHFGWFFVEFPFDVEKLFGTRSTVRVLGRMNGVEVDRALMPTKSGFHIIILGGELRKKMLLKQVGDTVKADIWLNPYPDKLDIPEELADTLDFLPDMKAVWDRLTPGTQRNMCYWVASAKTTATKAKRVAELLRRFESGHPTFGGKQLDL